MRIKTVEEMVSFILNKQSKNENMWKEFTDQFLYKTDGKQGYKGEYWGKVMRGAVLLYKYTQDEELYSCLRKTVFDLLQTQEKDGRISAYNRETEFRDWDVWCRKYVAVGLEYFYDICKSEEDKKIISEGLKRHCEYIMTNIKNITKTSSWWGGMNSCSILKSFVVLYERTKEEKYLQYAEYIISIGCMDGFDIFASARKGISPRFYKYRKAYEMTSCFEGLLEYYKVTKKEECLTACIRFGDAVLQEEITVVGGGACDTECFNHSNKMQVYPRKRPTQETCVTVSEMLYFDELYKVTGEVKYLDYIENAFYNAYMGTYTFDRIDKFHGLPIDWYSPLVHGTRKNNIVGGKQTFPSGKFYSCCTAIGSAGLGVFCNRAHTVGEDGTVQVEFCTDKQTIVSQNIVLEEKTAYPTSGKVLFTVKEGEGTLKLRIRIPQYHTLDKVRLNGNKINVSETERYAFVTENVNIWDEIEIGFLPKTLAIEKQLFSCGGVFAVRKGAIVYALDKRYASLFTTFRRLPKEEEIKEDNGMLIVKNGTKEVKFIPYSLAGNTFDKDSTLTVWVPYTLCPVRFFTKYYLRGKRLAKKEK